MSGKIILRIKKKESSSNLGGGLNMSKGHAFGVNNTRAGLKKLFTGSREAKLPETEVLEHNKNHLSATLGLASEKEDKKSANCAISHV